MASAIRGLISTHMEKAERENKRFSSVFCVPAKVEHEFFDLPSINIKKHFNNMKKLV